MAQKPLESSASLKSGKSIVAVYDGTERIDYIEDIYLVLAVTQEASNSVYSGIWNSNKDRSALHTEELSKIGVQAQSQYDALTEAEISEFTTIQNEMYTQLITGKDVSLIKLDPRHRDLLLQKEFDYLFWLSWSGFTLHIQALGLPTVESFNTKYMIYD